MYLNKITETLTDFIPAICLLVSTGFIIAVLNYAIKVSQKVNRQENEKDFRKWYMKCQHCKHAGCQGKCTTDDQYYFYCLHPDNKAFNNIYKVEKDFYCAKYEMPESLSIEMMNRRLDDSLVESKESPLRTIKNSKQDNNH